MRCLALADELRDHGAQITFVSRRLRGNLFQLVRAQGHEQRELACSTATEDMLDWQLDVEQTFEAIRRMLPLDWMVVDHYGIDARWEQGLRASARGILVIDDLANRRHECDILLDQNYYRNLEARYKGLVTDSCTLFLGPQYALLRKEFRRLVPRPLNPVRIRRLFVCFGGADLTAETEKVLAALNRPEFAGLMVDVVIGASNQRILSIEALCAQMRNVELHVQSDRMAELMSDADLAIGAGGATTWERLRCRVPTITVVVAENQHETTRDLAEAGAITYLGRAEDLAQEDYARAVLEALAEPERLAQMLRKGAALIGPANDQDNDGIACLARVMIDGGQATHQAKRQ